MKDKIYSCAICGREKALKPGEAIPDCCRLPMKLKLDKCTRPFVAETARNEADDEPCDDATDTSE